MRPPNVPRGRPGGTASQKAQRRVQSRGTRVTDPAAELEAWHAAVEHLHELGLPAAVPPFPAAWLRRRGVQPDWEAAA